MTDTTTTPTVHQALVQVAREVGAIGKGQTNDFHGYKFRGIDDVLNALHGPLTDAGVVIYPEVGEVNTALSTGKTTHVFMPVTYHVVGPAGDRLDPPIRAMGEATANDDKAANKALSAAYKYAMIQLLSIPTQDLEDADRSSPEADVAAERTDYRERFVAAVKAKGATPATPWVANLLGRLGEPRPGTKPTDVFLTWADLREVRDVCEAAEGYDTAAEDAAAQPAA